jgi:hypothetical protein
VTIQLTHDNIMALFLEIARVHSLGLSAANDLRLFNIYHKVHSMTSLL